MTALLALTSLMALNAADAQTAGSPIRMNLQCAERVLRLELREPRAVLLDGGIRIPLEAAHGASGVRYVANPSVGGAGQHHGSTFVWLKGDRARVHLGGHALPECEVMPHGVARQLEAMRWRAYGQEPGWSLSVGPGRVRWRVQPGSALPPAQSVRLTPLSTESGVRTYRLALREAPAAPERPWRLEVTDAVCRDAMSGMPHPQQVKVWPASGTPAPRLNGCGGDPAALLATHSGLVQSILGARLPPAGALGAPTLHFVADPPVATGPPRRTGSVSGQTGCNPFWATWTLTGEGLSLSDATSTQRGCTGDAGRIEQQFLQALQGVRRFDVSAQGLLMLLAADGQVLMTAAPN